MYILLNEMYMLLPSYLQINFNYKLIYSHWHKKQLEMLSLRKFTQVHKIIFKSTA